MVKLKRNMLSIALMSATMLVVGNAQAQSQQEEATREKISKEEGKQESDKDAAKEIDKVVVTGIRSGIEDAIETKKDSSQIVEAISAEDIGKLPDSSIADSIARLPGVTAQRERGRATQIQIRGFAGDFATTLLNGREQASTSDNRSAEFDQYPSELLSQVIIYKTADASLVGQGLSGTVDLQTIDPLSYDDRVISMQYRYDQNENNGDTESGSRYSFVYVDQFLDNTLGVSFGYAYMDSPAPGFQNEAWGYPNERWDGTQNVPAVPGHPGTHILGGDKVYKFDSDFQREGYAGTIQFKPNDFYETSFDAFYSTYDKSEMKSGLEFGTIWGTANGPDDLLGYTIGANDTVTSSQWKNVTPVIRNDSNPINNTTQAYGWNNIFTFNENWKMIVDLSTSEATSKFSLLETYAGLTGNGKTTLDINLNGSGDYNDFTFGTDLGNPANLQLVDAGNWGQDGYLKNFEVKDSLDAYRLDFVRSFSEGGISSIEFGVNYTDRSKTKSSDEYQLCINSDIQNGCGNHYDSAAYPGSTQSFGVGGIPTLATYDPRQLLNSGFYTLKGKNHPDIANKNWQVDETLTTWYAQANIDSEFDNGVRMTGNVGVQYVAVDQSSTGYATYAGDVAGQLVTNSSSYGNFLPSINLNFNFAENQFIRAAIAQQMARPRMDAMRASYDVSIAQGNCNGVPGPVWCGTGGNPELKPWLATAYDLSYEWYFTSEAGNTGYLSAAYFYKDLDTYIYYANVPHDYAGEPLPPPGPGQVPGVNYPGSTIGMINQPINGTGGVMKGYELTASVPLDALWKPLEGFGIQATYSSNSSNIEPFPGANQPIPGLSEEIWNATAYWERWGWSVRYSARYRSAFRGETRGFGADLSVIDISAETVQDAQIQYTFRSGTLENLSFYLQMSNIGDEPFRSDNGQNRPINYFEYGRQTLLGLSYKF